MILAAMAQGRSVIDSVLFSDDTRYMTDALRAMGFVVEVDEHAHRITVGGRGGVDPGARRRNLCRRRRHRDAIHCRDGHARRGTLPHRRQSADAPTADGSAARRDAASRRERVQRAQQQLPAGDRRRVARALRRRRDLDRRARSSQFVSAMLMPAPIWKAGPQAPRHRRRRPPVHRHDAAPDGSVGGAQLGRRRSDRRARRTMVSRAALRRRTGRVERRAISPRPQRLSAARSESRGSPRTRCRAMSVFSACCSKWARASRGIPTMSRLSGTGQLTGVDVAMNSMPDMVPTLAAIAPFASSPTKIRNVAFIRHHESDRIRALATELRRHRCDRV